jgi:hypothetical protein
MSAPSLVVEPILSTTVSNPFQIATAFSHTIVNSGPVSAGFDLSAPEYTVPTGGIIGGSGGISQATTGATFVSRADSNTNIIVTPTNQSYVATMLEGIQYYSSNEDLVGGERFSFSLPVSQYTGYNQASSGLATSFFTEGIIEFLYGLTVEFNTQTSTGGDIYIPTRNFSATYKLGSEVVHTFNGETGSFDVVLTMPGEASISIASNYGLPFGLGPKFLLQELYWTVPSTAPPTQTFPQAYSETTFYNTDDIVYAFGNFYTSTIDGNYGNRPDISFPFWMSTGTPGNISEWTTGGFYTINQIVFVVARGDVYDDRGNLITRGGETLVYYISLQNGNNNHPPATSPDWWSQGTTTPVPEPPTFSNWSSNTNYSNGQYVNYSNYNYVALLNNISNIVPSSYPDSWALISNTAPVFSVLSPVKVTNYPPGFPELTVGSLTSPQVLPFLTITGGYQIDFTSLTGFQSAPLSNLVLQIVQSIAGNTIQTTSYPINVTPITIAEEPELESPLSNITYKPFLYNFSIPTNLVNVVLRANALTTSSNLIPFIGYDGSFASTFTSDIGLTTSGITVLHLDAILNGNTIIASNVSTINTIATNIIVEPSIPTGSLSLFKFEPFSYTFRTNSESSGLVLRFSRSSSELQSFCSLIEEAQTITFQGVFNISFSTRLSLVIDLMFGNTVVETLTILMTVGQARFFPPVANQNFQLFQYENVSNTFGSNPVFLTALPITSIVSVPSLPSGLTFGGSCNSFFIQGTPLFQVPQSNYQVIGSNNTNGRIATVIVSIKVNPQLVRIIPSLSTLSGLNVDIPITPITLTAFEPETIYATDFKYTWTGLPDGFNFQDLNGSNVSNEFRPTNTALSIVLAGSPSLSFANYMSTLTSNLYQVRLTGTQTDQTGKQTLGTSLFNFSFAETVLINVSNSVSLYQSKPLGTTDVLITAGSFFSSALISSVIADSLPPGLSLVQYIPPRIYRLSGTPTEVNLDAFYTFTATNTNGNTRSITVNIPINPDIVSFGGNTPADGTSFRFIVSRPLTSAKTGYYTTPIVFTATSTSESTPIVYSSTIDFAFYGLLLNSSTGTLTGIPTIPLPITGVSITATDALGTIGTTSIQLTILADEFTWPNYQPSYFQNRPITPFQFVMVATLSERSIQSFSSADLPTGLFISAGGLLSGTPTEFPEGGVGSFTITATTGYSTLSQAYTYSMIADQLLIVQKNGTDAISRIFSGIEYQSIQYSIDSIVSATFSIGELTPGEEASISVSSNGLVSGDFTNATIGTVFSTILSAEYRGLTTLTLINIVFSDSGGIIYIPTESSELTFIKPTQTSFTFFQYVSYSIPIEASGSSEFIYYYATSIPVGFQITKDSTGISATVSGIPSTLADQSIVIYAKIASGYPVSTVIRFRTITPFFVSPQLGAGAYTSILRNDVLGNAAQNARDIRVFPQVNPLAGPLMAPRAPDVVTPPDCILKLCKKPCPTCHTMM